MAAFIRSVLALVNLEIARVLAPQAIEQVCRELKHTWRSCTFDPATTVKDYALPPESILVRELRYRVAQKGYRVKEI